MKYVLVALAVFATACTAGKDRYLPKFGARQAVATTDGPVTFAVAPDDRIYFAELRTNAFHYADAGGTHDLFTTRDKPDSLVVDGRLNMYVAARNKAHRLSITRYERDRARVIWQGPVSRFAAHLAYTDGNNLIVGLRNQIFYLDPVGEPDQKPLVISTGYTDPIITPGRGTQIWVADNALPGSKERVARGREQDHAKRNRFASALPQYTNPSDMVLLKDELLLCSKTHEKVYRLHIGLDEVARRRDWLPGLVCDRDIGVTSDGSLITATTGAIYKYPPR